jgi:hypothetical protein
MTVTIDLTASPAAVVTGIGQCVVDALEQTPAGAPTRQCLLLPTFTIPWDNCDCGGQIAQAITQVYNAESFPQPFTGNWKRRGPHRLIVQVTLQVVRCVPSMDDQGSPPSCASSLAAAITLENDRTAVRQALACCLSDLAAALPPTLLEYNIGPSVTVGELGGCAGIETVYLLSFRSCLCH